MSLDTASARSGRIHDHESDRRFAYDDQDATGPLPAWVDDVTGPLSACSSQSVADSGPIELPDLADWDELEQTYSREPYTGPRGPATALEERPVAAPAGLAPGDDAEVDTDDRTSTTVKGGVAVALLALAAGGSTAVAMDKEVTVSVDGVDQVVNTFSSDVAGALDSADVELGPADRLAPGPDAEVDDGDRIVVDRARDVTLMVDGKPQNVTTTARTVDDALAQIGLPMNRMVASAPMNAAIPANGMSLDVRTPKTVMLADGGAPPRPVNTTALTPAELLAQQGIPMGPADTVAPGGTGRLAPGSTVTVTRNAVRPVTETRPIAPPMRTIDDPTMEKGETEVVTPGKAGEERVNWSVRATNGKETGRTQVGAPVVTKAPVGGTVKRGTKPKPTAPPVTNAAKWDSIAECEASGDWSTDTGNGYSGGLQFDRQTWASYGGTKFASKAGDASREEQISIAEKVREDRGGFGAWPVCGSQ